MIYPPRIKALFEPEGIWQPAGFIIAAGLLGILLVHTPLVMAMGLISGTAVLLLIFIEPLVGVGLALLAGPLGAWESVQFGLSPLDSGQIILLITLTAWGANKLARRSFWVPKTRLAVPLAGFVLVMAGTVAKGLSIPIGIRELLKWGEIGLFMLVVLDRGRGQKQLWVLAMLFLAGLSQSAYAFWQFALRGDGPSHFHISGRLYRAYGTFMQPNPLGGFVNLTLLLALGTLLGLITHTWNARRRPTVNNSPSFIRAVLPIFLIFIIVCIAILGLLASWSRGAWLGFAAALPIVIFFWPRKHWHGLLLLISAVFLGAIGLFSAVRLNMLSPAIVDRVTGFSDDLVLGDVRGQDLNDANYSVVERLAHWQAAVGMARDHIWLGVGFGNYELAYADYALANWPDPLGHAHNYYLNMLAETGVIGLAVYLLFWTAVFRQLFHLLRVSDWQDRGILLGLLAAWTAVSIHHLVDKLYVNNIYIHMGVMLGLQQLIARKYQSTRLPYNTNEL